MKQAVAAYEFNKENFETIVTHAVYACTRTQSVPASVSAISQYNPPGFSLPGAESLDEAFLQDPSVAAIQFGQRGGRGGRGG